MFYNDVNSKTLKHLEDMVTTTASMHDIIGTEGGR
jgi:hypothetical protein